MFDAKTPEAAAYLAQREATQKYQQRIWQRVAIVLGVALTISVGTNLWGAHLTDEIRSTQVSNTRVTQCQDKYFDAAVHDVPLLIAGDKNKADYARGPKSC